MTTENSSDIIFNNLEVENLVSDYQKFYYTKNIIIINKDNSNYTITNSNSNNIFIIEYESGIINIILSDNLKNGLNINFYFKSNIYQFNIINNNNLYNFNGSYILINDDVIGKSILKTSSSNSINNFNIKYDNYSIMNINNSNLNFLLNKNIFIIKGVINNKILYKVKFDNINNIIYLNDNINPELSFYQSYSYIFDISDESMKNITFNLFDTNNNIYNKNIIKIGEEGYINSKLIIDIPINLLNFSETYPIKLKYGLNKNIIVLDTEYTTGNYETNKQNIYTKIPQKYINQLDRTDNSFLEWKILNNNEIKFHFNNELNILTYFKFYYKLDNNTINNNNKIQNIILYGSQNEDYSTIYELYNESYTLSQVFDYDYLEKTFHNTKIYKYYKFVLNAFSSHSINLYCFTVGTDYSNTNKGIININNNYDKDNFFQSS